MARCPNGHESTSSDYCDVCGEPIVTGGAPGAAEDPPTAPSAVVAPAFAVPAPGAAGTCANCGAPVSGRFCEACGFDTALPAPAVPAGPVAQVIPVVPEPENVAPAPAPEAVPGSTRTSAVTTAVPSTSAAGWIVSVRADRDWSTRALARQGPDAGSISFPPYYAERRFRLKGAEMMIGKHDEAAGIHPDIDLRGNPEDPGISRTHAVLRARPDGGWEVVDIGSTNGTTVGDAADPVAEFTPVPLNPGESFHIGAWTTVTLLHG